MHDWMAQPERSFYITGGTLPLDASSYVVREADTDLFNSLVSGEFCYVLNTRQMGKSSLMVRTAVRLRQAGARVAVLDLTAIGQNVSPEQWYGGLLDRLGRQLDLEDELEEFSDRVGRLGPMQRFLEAITQVALPDARSPVAAGHGAVRIAGLAEAEPGAQIGPETGAQNGAAANKLIIFVDEIDAIRSLPFSVDEFFAGIRECYNRRAEDRRYDSLVFCLLGVATPSDLITDTRMSPFNIGRRIVLADFTPQEARPLAAGLTASGAGATSARNGGEVAPRAQALLDRVLYWTGGHPYMTQRLCRAVAEYRGTKGAAGSEPTPRDVDRLCAALFFSKDARETDDNLAFVRNRLLRGDGDVPALLDLYRRALSGRRVKDDETSLLIAALRLTGIVKVVDGLLTVRNRIYASVFDRAWISTSMPGAEVERQRAAYRAGVLRAALVGGGVAIAMGALAVSSLVYKHRAEQSAQTAREQTFKAQVSASQAQMSEKRARESEKRAQQLAASEQQEKQKAVDFGSALAQTFEKLTREQKVAQANFLSARASALRAHNAEESQQIEMKRLNRVLYDSTMNLVQREYEAHEYERMQELLNQTQMAEDKGFEWRFWRGLCPLQRSISAHSGEVLALDYAPDGRRFVTGGVDKTVQVSDAATGRSLARWTEDGEIRAVAFSPDSKRIAIGLSDNDRPGRAVLCDAETGKTVMTLPLSRAVWAIAYSHDGTRVATNGDRVQVWDAVSGKPLEDYGPGGPALAFSPDDTELVFSRWAESGKPADVDVLDLRQGTYPVSLIAPNSIGQVRALAWSGDGAHIATAGDDHIARLWDARSGQLLRSFVGHTDTVISASFSPNGARLVTSSLDDESRVWDLDTPVATRRPLLEIGPLNRAPIRDLRNAARESRILFKHARHAVFSTDGQHIVTGSYSGVVRIWSALPAASYLVLDGPPVVSLDHVGAVALAPDGRLLASAIDSPVATLWNASGGTRIRDLRGHSGDVSALAFFPDGTHVLSGGWDGTVRIWDAIFPRRTVTLQGHKGDVNCVAVSPNGRKVVTAGEDRTGMIWDARTERRIATLSLGSSVAHGIAFSPDGAKIVVAQNDNAKLGRITLWDANTGQMLRTIASVPARVLAIRFSPDGTRVLAGVDDKTARIWDVQTGKLLLTLGGHSSGVNSVAFSSDGRRIATGSFDTTVKLWDARTGHEILTLHHPTFVVGVAISRDRRRIVTACEDGSTRIWTAE